MRFREPFKAHKGYLLLKVTEDMAQAMERTGATELEYRFIDPREHSKLQHGKVFALCSDISEWSGHGMTDLIYWSWLPPEGIRADLTDKFCALSGLAKFSMKDVDVDTCRSFISFLVDFCLENLKHGLHTKQPLGKLAEDTERYIYMCLQHRVCTICGHPADIHHVDAIGMGTNRNKTGHLGRRAIALCRTHHTEAHTQGVKTFFEMHHLPHGVLLDEYLCGKLGLNTEESRE